MGSRGRTLGQARWNLPAEYIKNDIKVLQNAERPIHPSLQQFLTQKALNIVLWIRTGISSVENI